jgi:putative aldouronate transport system substrate-binding protein
MEKFDQAMEKQNSGRVLISPCNWSVSGANAEFAKNGELDKGFMAIKTPSTITQVCNFFKNPFSGRFAWAITSKCKTPEKAMDLINFLNSGDGTRLLLNGIEGVNWNVGNDGVPHLTSDTLQLLKKGSVEDQLKAGLGGTNGLLLMYQGSWDRKYNCPAAFVNNEDVSAQMVNATPFEKDFCDHYTVAYPDQLWEKILPEQSKVHDGSYMSMIGLPTAEIKQIDDNLLNYLLVQMVKIVNSKTDEDFDAAQAKIIADCKAMGSETAFNWYKSQYDAAIGNMKAFYDSIK